MKYSFNELFDINKVQGLIDELYRATSIPYSIVGMDGDVLIGSGWQRICTDFHRQHPLTRKACVKSNITIREAMDNGNLFSIYKCPHGLIDASSPLIISGEHIANVFAGQVFLTIPDKEKDFIDQAQKFGFDEIEYIKAFREVPIFTEEKFQSILSVLAKIVQIFAQMGQTRLGELESISALKKSEKRFKILFNESVDPVLVYKSGRFTDGNQAAVDMLRTESLDQILNCTPADLSPDFQPDGRRSDEKSLAMDELACAHGNHSFEWTHKRADGEKISVEVMLTSIGGKGSSCFIAAWRDITERNKAKRELEKISFDLRGRVRELNCLYSISKIAEKKKPTIDNLMQSVIDIIPSSFQCPETTCVKACIGEMVFKTSHFKETQWKLYSPLCIDKKKVGYLEIFHIPPPLPDKVQFLKEKQNFIGAVCERVGKIIDRIQISKALKETEERYQILTDLFADGIAVIQNGQYEFANNAFARMAGYTAPKSLIGMKFHPFISTDFISQYSDSVNIGTYPDDVPDKIEYKFLPKRGKAIWVEEKRNVIHWHFAPALLCTLRDITEKKEQEILIKEETKQLRQENILLRSSLKKRYRFQNIIGMSPGMQHVYDQILTAANSNVNISIFGESGTGKEMVAKAIHDLSNREANTFVTINCGAVPEPLLESEFFGYKKGAFTGAVIDKHGFLDLADKGTLFLDEVGELSLSIQAKLLRAIDGGGYYPIGSTKKSSSDFRIIAATNKDLKEEVIKGNMREDFFYRIQVIPIKLPPLRERKEDIPLLVDHFTQMLSKETKCNKVPDRITTRLCLYHWPGNVRELRNVLLRYFSTKELTFLDLNSDAPNNKADTFYKNTNPGLQELSSFVEAQEKKQIRLALQRNNWHRMKTADQLGMSRSTLFRKMNKYGLTLKHL